MTKVIILAAGKGQRMKNKLPKVLVPFRGRPMITYLVQSVLESGVDNKPIIIVSPENKSLIKEALEKYDCEYVTQKKQQGTASAVLCVKERVGGASRLVVFYGDHPFITAETIKKLKDIQAGAITMMTVRLKDFKDWRNIFYQWGRIARGKKNKIEKIIEFKDARPKDKTISEVNPAIYSFDNVWLWDNINRINNNNAQKEYYLTDLIKLAFEDRLDINSLTVSPCEAIGINSKEELGIAEGLLK